jgi:hypothetical protein
VCGWNSSPADQDRVNEEVTHQDEEGGDAERGGCACVGHGASVAENVSRSSSQL